VNFEVRRFAQYGRLSGKNLEELQAGPRGCGRAKIGIRGFRRSGRPRSPASRPGRAPGAMRQDAHRVLGHGPWSIWGRPSISTAAVDLIFPHHEKRDCPDGGGHGTSLRPVLDAQRVRESWALEKMSKSLGTRSRSGTSCAGTTRRAGPSICWVNALPSPHDFADERITEAARALGRLRASHPSRSGSPRRRRRRRDPMAVSWTM